jgi:branched-chain amino acid transport system substrate-binding protein
LVASTALVLAACGGDDDDAAEPAEEPAAEPAEEPAEEPAAEPAEEPAEEPAAEPAEGSGEPIKIGMLTSLTGNFAPWGIQVQGGMQLAVQDINDAGGVNGRTVELVEVDDQTNAEEGVAGFEQLVEEGVVGVGGVISSDIGLATSPLAEELTTPLFMVKAGATDILTADSRHVFRTCLPSAPMVSGPVAQYVVENGLTRVGAIIADYGWGQAIKAALEADFAELPDVELQIETAPVPEQDFTTYLRNLEALDPELIVATGHPPGSGPITVQSADLGLDVPISGAYSPWALVQGGAGDAGFGRYTDFDCADYQSADYAELATKFLAMSDQPFMDDDAVAGYGIVTVLAQAAGEVGDDPAAIAEYLHGQTFDLPGYAFPLSWTEWGELAEATPIFSVLGEGPAPEGLNEAGDWWPETLLTPEPLEPYEPG